MKKPSVMKRQPCLSADGHKIVKGTEVFSIFTIDGGTTWHVDGGRIVRHTNYRGMCCFESPPQWWYGFPTMKGKSVGDNRLYFGLTAAREEAERRNKHEGKDR